MKRPFFAPVAFALCFLTTTLAADEPTALAQLQQAGKAEVIKHKDGAVKEISINNPQLDDAGLALFTQFPRIEKIALTHAGVGTKMTGAGVAAWKVLPHLRYVTVGGDVGGDLLAAFGQLSQISELYVQTTTASDAEVAPLNTLTKLTFFGIRVRNTRKSTKMTDRVFDQLGVFPAMATFRLGGMKSDDGTSLVEWLAKQPKLKVVELQGTQMPEAVVAQLKAQRPGLEVKVSSKKDPE